MSDMVGNPKDQFSCISAHVVNWVYKGIFLIFALNHGVLV